MFQFSFDSTKWSSNLMSLIFFSPRAICQQLLVYIRGQEAGHIFVVVVHFADKSDLVFSGVIGVILLPPSLSCLSTSPSQGGPCHKNASKMRNSLLWLLFRRGPILNNYYSEHLTQENGRVVLKLPCGEKALFFVA